MDDLQQGHIDPIIASSKFQEVGNVFPETELCIAVTQNQFINTSNYEKYIIKESARSYHSHNQATQIQYYVSYSKGVDIFYLSGLYCSMSEDIVKYCWL